MTLAQTFKWPALMALLTTAGLIAGLVSDGWGDVLACIGLAVPTGFVIGRTLILK